MRVAYGSAYAIFNNILVYTTQDLSVGDYDATLSTDRYFVESIKIPANITKIKYSNGEVSAEAGTTNDIFTYKEAGKYCSRVIVVTRTGRIEKLIVINGDF
jgi:hypothetical protein